MFVALRCMPQKSQRPLIVRDTTNDDKYDRKRTSPGYQWPQTYIKRHFADINALQPAYVSCCPGLYGTSPGPFSDTCTPRCPGASRSIPPNSETTDLRPVNAQSRWGSRDASECLKPQSVRVCFPRRSYG